MSGRIPHGRSRAGGGLGAVLGARRGVGGDSPGAVAVSLAREDHTTTKEQSLVGFGTLGKLRESAIFFLPNALSKSRAARWPDIPTTFYFPTLVGFLENQ